MLARAQELLRLSQMDVHELARSHEDAERWLVALAGLHKREVRAAHAPPFSDTCRTPPVLVARC